MHTMKQGMPAACAMPAGGSSRGAVESPQTISGDLIPLSPGARSATAMFRGEQGILAGSRGPGLRLRSPLSLRIDRRAPEGPARPVPGQTGRRPLPLALSLSRMGILGVPSRMLSASRGGVWGGVTPAPPVGRAPEGGSKLGTSSPQASLLTDRAGSAGGSSLLPSVTAPGATALRMPQEGCRRGLTGCGTGDTIVTANTSAGGDSVAQR
jgi:hypothetical protein